MAFQQIQAPRALTSVRPLTTAHLAQTMSLLSLNAAELAEEIENQLANNPALDMVEERRCPSCNRRLPPNGPCPKCSYQGDTNGDEPIVFVSAPEYQYSGGNGAGQYEDLTEEIYPAEKQDLPTYVLRQIATELEPEERPIAAHVLSSLDEDGFLSIPVVEIVRYHHASLDRVMSVISLIQHADPVGVGSSGPKEALLAQVESLGENVPWPEKTAQAIREGMDLLSRHKYGELGRLLGVPKSQAEQIAEFIAENLNPFPARAYWGSARQQANDIPDVYQKPDVLIRLRENAEEPQLIIEILWPLRGILRVNPKFKQALNQAPDSKLEQWKDDIEKANLLVKCLGQRNHTLVRLMHLLAIVQRDFILHGDAHIKPITRAQLAEELEVHESTISRAVAGKTVQLPSRQIIPIARFFDRSLHIRTALKEIIDDENKPLSDTAIAKLLAKQGFEIARRTVAKYRAMEGILPAHLRKAQAN